MPTALCSTSHAVGIAWIRGHRHCYIGGQRRAITGIALTSHGSNYTTDHVLTLDNTGSSGRQADISVTLNSTGHLAVAEIETLGTGYTSLPTIVLSGTGTGGVITPGLGGSFNWLANDNPNSADGAVCIEGGHIIDLGQDLDNDGGWTPRR